MNTMLITLKCTATPRWLDEGLRQIEARSLQSQQRIQSHCEADAYISALSTLRKATGTSPATTPVFVRDALKFPDFIHTQKRHPRTNMRSPTAMWDFWSLPPESLHHVTVLMSPRPSADLSQYRRFRLAHLFIHQRQERELLGNISLQDYAPHQELDQRCSG
jgi:hypothetical protein